MNSKSERQDNFFDVCGQCKTGCCQNARPPITRERRKIIESFLREQKIPVENPFVQTGYTFPREDAEGYCIFYDKEARKCRVHPVKPETCVAGPITFDINSKSEKIEWFLKMEKICSLAGKLFKDKPMFKKHVESAKEEIFRLVRELDAEALQAILKIGEPETFKIDEDNIGEEVSGKLSSKP